jgi:hypothetical protein
MKKKKTPLWYWDLLGIERGLNEARECLLAGKYVAAYQRVLDGLSRYREAVKTGVIQDQ